MVGGGAASGSFSAPPAVSSVCNKCLVNHQSSEERVRLVCGFFVKHAMLLEVSSQGTTFHILLGQAAKVFTKVQPVSQPADELESRSRSGQECYIYLKL